MFPVTENPTKDSGAMKFDTFVKRFDDIVKNHVDLNRVKAFAFIFYDLKDKHIKKVIKDGYQEFDRLSGKDLTIFYLDGKSPDGATVFNEVILNTFKLEQDITLPCIVFFKLIDGEIAEIKIVNIIQTDFLASYTEMYNAIRKYINTLIVHKISPDSASRINIKKIAIEQFFNALFSAIYKPFTG